MARRYSTATDDEVIYEMYPALEAEVRRLTEERDRWRSAWQGADRGWAEDQARAEAAEADVRRLTEALAECERQFQAQVAARTAEAEAADRGGRVRTCEQEMRPFWSGDGCACAVFDIERPKPGCDDCGRWHVREECPEAQR